MIMSDVGQRLIKLKLASAASLAEQAARSDRPRVATNGRARYLDCVLGVPAWPGISTSNALFCARRVTPRAVRTFLRARFALQRTLCRPVSEHNHFQMSLVLVVTSQLKHTSQQDRRLVLPGVPVALRMVRRENGFHLWATVEPMR